MLKLLINSLAKDFYQRHAGFFLFGIYFLFGIPEPSQLIEYNKALLLAGISSPVGMAVVFISWVLYAAKAHLFINQKLRLHQYNFTKEIGSREKGVQLKLWLSFNSVILLPILIYVILLIILGLKFQFYSSVTSIIVVFLALFFVLAWLRFHSMTFDFLKQENKLFNIQFKIKRPFFSWPIHYLFNEQLLMLLLCKIISLFLFKGILWMFADVGDDIRVLLTALLASVICHSGLVINLLRFETEQLNFGRSLPIRISKRLRNWLLVFSIILLPEWVLFTVTAHYNLYSIANGLLFGLTGLFFLLTLLYLVKLNLDSYIKSLLFFFFITLYIILGHYYILYSLLMITFSLLFYVRIVNKIDFREIK